MRHYFEIARLILQGFTYKTARQYLELKSDNDDAHDLKKVMSLLPINKPFDKWFEDLLSVKLILKNYAEWIPEVYCVKFIRNKETLFYDLKKAILCDDLDQILSVLKSKKSVLVSSLEFEKLRYAKTCEYRNNQYYKDGQLISEDEMRVFLNQIPDGFCIMENILGRTSEVVVINSNSASELVYKIGRVSESCKHISLAIAKKFPEIEYMHFVFVSKQNNNKIFQIDTGLSLAKNELIRAKCKDYIEYKSKEVKSKKNFKYRTIKKYMYAYIAKKKGFVDYMYRNWNRGKKEDWKTRNTSIIMTLWAHRRGFYSYRIAQYGLNSKNYKAYLSDYTYKKMRPLNNEYRKWFWDKLSLYHVLSKYRQFLPKYYFYLSPGKNVAHYENSEEICCIEEPTEGILNLLQEKGKLVLKPVIASHGDGFYKLEFYKNKYIINNIVMSREEVSTFLSSLKTQYLVTEYVEMHHTLKRIFPYVTGTIRLMVINRNCIAPVIEDAYIRIATKETGYTDNIAKGGVFAHINKENGYYGNAQIVHNHVITPCKYHPNTGVKIEGIIPRWQEICSKVIEICHYIFPIEYMGFDIVVTDQSFKILEINTHQDLHRYPEYNDEIKEYLNSKIKY